jgi:long-chain acyl-CoA synthetase
MQNMAIDILNNARRYGESVAMTYKVADKWQETTYADMADQIDAMAAALISEGVRAGDRVGIFSPNQPRWIIADYAIMSIRAITVPIYATSTGSQAAEIIRDSGMRMILAGTETEYLSVMEILDECESLQRVVAMNDEIILQADHSIHMGDLLDRRHEDTIRDEIDRRRSEADPEELATIIYTSGTTGTPKGVMLNHANFVNQFTTLDDRFEINADDRSLCFLPLSHVYERSWSAYLFLRGARNTILRNPAHVVNALAVAKPNVMVSAPRLYEKISAAVLGKAEAAPPVRRKLFHWALGVGERYWNAVAYGRKAGAATRMQYKLADKLVLSKVRAVVGGPKKFLSSGGAPLAKDVEEFFLKVGLLVCQGYGLTETAPMLTCNAPGDFKFGTVGRPIDDVEIRIADSGEIEARGPNVTSGYFNNWDATQEAMNHGWFRTGDIGHLDEDGFLVITDRIKDLIVTSGGKNVAPQRIESMVGKDLYIDQLAVVGDRRQFISAIIVPAFETLKEFAGKHKLQFRDTDELVKLPEVVELYRKRIREQSTHLASFEKIKRFTLVAKQFSMQAGEITPTLKVRRKVIAEKYHKLIEHMYTQDKSREDSA